MTVLLMVVNAPEFFLSHRLPVALAAREVGYKVEVATGPGPACKRIKEWGFTHHELPLSRSSNHPVAEFRSVWALHKLLLRVKPSILHLVTIKPVVYGALLARLLGVPAVVVAISGWGTVFLSRRWYAPIRLRAIQGLYKLALGHSNLHAIFQNPDDLNGFVKMRLLKPGSGCLIHGSGVDLRIFTVRSEPVGETIVTFAARLIKDKGLLEFVEAVRILKQRGCKARFWIAGAPDPGNESSVSNREIAGWRDQGLVELLGLRTDMDDVLSQSHIVVLPSYREGLPKVLAEAAASGRAVITTNVPGCRDAVIPDVTGLLVPARDPAALAIAIETLVQNPRQRQQMGQAGRELAESRFSIEHVVRAHLGLYAQALSKNT